MLVSTKMRNCVISNLYFEYKVSEVPEIIRNKTTDISTSCDKQILELFLWWLSITIFVFLLEHIFQIITQTLSCIVIHLVGCIPRSKGSTSEHSGEINRQNAPKKDCVHQNLNFKDREFYVDTPWAQRRETSQLLDKKWTFLLRW